MRSVLFRQTGSPPSVSSVVSSPDPIPGPGEVRRRLRVAPINPADLNFIEGSYGRKPDLPATPGMEGVGSVDALGPDVSNINPGDVAIPLGPGSTWAETIVRPAADLLVLPPSIDLHQAAMLRVNPATAWGLLHSRGQPHKGSWIVQNAASSAAAHCVISLARHLGLHSLNLVRRPESAAACLAAGADIVLTDDPSAPAAAAAIPGFSPPSLAINAVGGDSALRLLNLLAPGGTMATYGAMSRQPLKVPNGLLIFKDLHLNGFWLTRWLSQLPPADVRSLYATLASLVLNGSIHQPVAATYPLANLHDALLHASTSARNGKILLDLHSQL
jgi:trans-2-enoyl-CoA reductase